MFKIKKNRQKKRAKGPFPDPDLSCCHPIICQYMTVTFTRPPQRPPVTKLHFVSHQPQSKLHLNVKELHKTFELHLKVRQWF